MPVLPASQKQQIPAGAQRHPVRICAVIHSLQPGRPSERQHIAALLVHPQEIQPRHIDERVMGGKHHLLGLHPSPLRPQRAPLRRDHPAMLKNLQLFRQRAQKPKGVEPGLSFQPGRPLHGKRELRLQCEGTLQAQPAAVCASCRTGSSSWVE